MSEVDKNNYGSFVNHSYTVCCCTIVSLQYSVGQPKQIGCSIVSVCVKASGFSIKLAKSEIARCSIVSFWFRKTNVLQYRVATL